MNNLFYQFTKIVLREDSSAKIVVIRFTTLSFKVELGKQAVIYGVLKVVDDFLLRKFCVAIQSKMDHFCHRVT
jgi:hypothetical protein